MLNKKQPIFTRTAEREADLIVKEAKRETSSLKKKHFWRQRKKLENIVNKSMQNLSLNAKSWNKIESRLTERFYPWPAKMII